VAKLSRRRLSAKARQVEKRIEQLRSKPVATYSGKEDLKAPVDSDMVVQRHGRRYKLILMLDGQPVSSANIGICEPNFGGVFLRVATVGGVGTPMDHRFKGYSRRVMINSLRWMRQSGFDMTLLFGIRAFYPKYGYAPVIPYVRFSLDAEAAGRFSPAGLRTIPFTMKHLSACLRLYRRTNARRTGTIRRDVRTWRPFRRGLRWGGKVVCKVIVDGRDRPVGYFAYTDHPERWQIIEAGFSGPKVFPALLAAAGRLARRRGDDRVKFALSEDSELMAFCKPLGIEKTVHYRPDGGGMARMVNIRSSLTKLGTVLAGRMSRPGRITIRTNMEDVSLAWSSGKMRVGDPRPNWPNVWMPQWALAQMLYGWQDARVFASQRVIKAPAKTIETLTEMMPSGPHHFYWTDVF